MICPSGRLYAHRCLAAFSVCAAIVVSMLTSDAAAQSGNTRQAAGPPQQLAPVIRFDSAGITLEEAVRLTLEHEPAIKRQEAVLRSQEGVLQENAGFFDSMLAASGSYNYLAQEMTQTEKLQIGGTDIVSRDGTVALQLTKPFRSGPSLAPFADVAYQGTQYQGLVTGGTYNTPNLFTGRLGLGFTVPLARGLGPNPARASETAARFNRDAERLALDHQIATSVLATIQAYWDLRAAQETVDITARWVDAQVKLTELTRDLIKADELPQVEIARAQAAEARARADLDQARRNLYTARVSLAAAAGVAASGDDATLPRARDQFPALPDLSLLTDTVTAQFGDRAVADRPDLAAALLRERAGAAVEEGARANVRTRVDLTAQAYAVARDEGTVFNSWAGPSGDVSLQAERPIGNNTLRGQFTTSQANTNQARITAVDLRRQIVLGVVDAARAAREMGERVRQAEAAVGFARATVEAERARFRSGESTLIDTVLTEQQQTESELAFVAARHDLFLEIARLRFQAGQLAPGGKVSPGDLVLLPSPGGRQR